MIQGLLSEHGIPSMLKRGPGFDMPEFMPVGPRQVFVAEAAPRKRAKCSEGNPGRRASRRWGRPICAQVGAPGVLDLADARLEGRFQGRRRAAGQQLEGEPLAGLRAALVLEQVEDRAAEDHRVAARGREGGAGALAQAADHRRPVEADLAGEVLGAAFDQPGPAQVAGEAARRPGGGQRRGCWRRPRAARRAARRCRAAPRASPRRRRGAPCGGR